MDIIPALDLLAGQVVRLRQGNYAQQTTYADTPLALAQRFEAEGCTRLHVVDLDGAKAGTPVHLAVLEEIAANTALSIDYSGGLRTAQNLADAYSAGATFVCLGSISVQAPDTVSAWGAQFGVDKIILSADVKAGIIQTHGWLQGSGMALFDYLKNYMHRGFTTFCCTDIAQDGMLAGPNTALYASILAAFPSLKLIASGGVSTAGQVASLQELGCAGAIVGKAVLDGHVSLQLLISQTHTLPSN